MQSGSDARRVSVAFLAWTAVLISLTVWALLPSYVVGWDVNVYRNTLLSLRAGHDPYLDALTIQRAYYAHLQQHVHDPLPFSYIYSPLTLPALRLIAHAPFRVSAAVYWGIYCACAVLILRFGMWAAEESERRVLAGVAPICVFFPGLLQHDTIFSGNVAIPVYGCALTAAILGWKRGVWAPFYAVVVLASCFKAPLLCLVVVPVLSAPRQWIPAGGSAFVGVGLFAVQRRIWPALFGNYLQALDFQFRLNRDFSSSPAGVAANFLFGRLPYRMTSLVVYLLCAATVGGLLLRLSQRFLAGKFGLKQWVPVMTLGVFLLNPRLMEYDLLPLSLPMLLIVWRSFNRRFGKRRLAWGMVLLFVILNVCMLATESFHPIECALLLGIFGLGCRDLWRRSEEVSGLRAGGTLEFADGELKAVALAGAATQ